MLSGIKTGLLLRCQGSIQDYMLPGIKAGLHVAWNQDGIISGVTWKHNFMLFIIKIL